MIGRPSRRVLSGSACPYKTRYRLLRYAPFNGDGKGNPLPAVNFPLSKGPINALRAGHMEGEGGQPPGQFSRLLRKERYRETRAALPEWKRSKPSKPTRTNGSRYTDNPRDEREPKGDAMRTTADMVGEILKPEERAAGGRSTRTHSGSDAEQPAL